MKLNSDKVFIERNIKDLINIKGTLLDVGNLD